MASVNERIGNYHIIRQLATGAFGRVYLGQHTVLTNRTVAIKLMHANSLDSLEKQESFLQEARFLEILRHPYILPIVDVGIHDGLAYLVTEYAPNGSLRHALSSYSTRPIPLERSLSILNQIGQALHHAHQQQIIHRDLKPENILFNAKGDAVLTDFGIATVLATMSVKFIDNSGTPAYMSPEQFQGQVSKESDQYAFGCIAYELFTGHPAYSAPDLFSMGFKHMTEAPVPLRQHTPQLSPYIEQAVLKAMAKQRSDRHPDIKAFISALNEAALAQENIPTILATEAALTQENIPTILIAEAPQPSAQRTFTSTIKAFQPDERRSIDPYSEKSTALNVATSEDSRETFIPFQQGPDTPLPLSRQGPVTPLPFPEQGNVYASGGNIRASLPSSWRTTHGEGSTPKGGMSAKLKWSIIALIALLLLGSFVGVLALMSNSTPSKGGVTLATPTQGGITQAPTSMPPTAKPTHKPIAPTVPVNRPTPSPSPIKSVTPVSSPSLRPTPSPSSLPSPTLSPSPPPPPTPSPSPSPLPPSEVLVVPLTSGPSGMLTQNSYSGQITVIVCGVGQSFDVTAYSDAFYVYTDKNGNPLNPPQHKANFPDWVLWINNQATDNYTPTPAYNSSHIYTFTMNAPGGQISFGVGDNIPSDNTGYFYVAINQSNPYC